MKGKSLKRRIKFIKSLKNDRNKLKHMEQCSNHCIEYICEACHNILIGNIKMPTSLRNKLKKHRKVIRKLANPKQKTSILLRQAATWFMRTFIEYLASNHIA